MSGRRTVFFALLLVAAGVVFRVWAVGHARFTGDESYFWATARNIATGDAAPVFGPPMTGSQAYHPGPLFYYLMAVPQFFGDTPWLGGIFVVLLHAVASWLFFLFVLRAKGDRAGLVALALLMFAPWDVLYADRIWLSCVAPVWGTVTVYAAHRSGGSAASAAWQGVLVFFALVCPQFHMSAPVVWIVCAVLLACDPPARVSRRALAIGLGLAVAAYAYPIYWELGHKFENTVAILTKGTGNLDGEGMVAAPFRVFGYAVLYGTSEIGYHFARGYWSTFHESNYYGSAAGLKNWFELHGVWSIPNLVSIFVAAAAWIWACVKLVRGIRRARAAGSIRKNLELGDRVTLGLLLALFAAAVLMIAAKKDYFPHYTNLLMPVVLWPLVSAIDDVLSSGRRWARALGAAAVAVSAAAMMSSCVRYYRDVDALNGLAPTIAMVDRAIEDIRAGRIALGFDHFNNGYAWQMLANVAHDHSLDVAGNAPVRYQIHNGAPHRGPLPPNGELFGPVLLQRSGPQR